MRRRSYSKCEYLGSLHWSRRLIPCYSYFDYMNLSVSLLDPELYTAQKTYWRSPFLFTVGKCGGGALRLRAYTDISGSIVCAIASRHHCSRPELYQEAMKYARLAAGSCLIGGQKTIEAVQAYMLLSLYPVPARRWEDDRNFMYLGLAIRSVVLRAFIFTKSHRCLTQNGHRVEASSSCHSCCRRERTEGTRNAQPHAHLAYLLQPRPLYQRTVRAEPGHQQQGLRCKSHR